MAERENTIREVKFEGPPLTDEQIAESNAELALALLGTVYQQACREFVEQYGYLPEPHQSS